jgi:2,5-diketo-D-gluconate reductase A
MTHDDSDGLRLTGGHSMPSLGLGTWQLNIDTPGSVDRALRMGYRMIDTSGDYGTQPGVGEGIRRSGLDRDDIFLTTKVEEDEDAYEATGRDLQELRLDYADLMLIHRPPRNGAGVELWEGLIRARDNELTREIGVSNYTLDQIDQLVRATNVTPAVNQIEWSPFGWSQEMLDGCRERGIVIQAYSPLTRSRRLADARLAEIAAAVDRTPAQVLIRWGIQQGVAPLPKANRPEHQEEDLAVFDFALDDDQTARLAALNETYSSLGSLPYV